MKKLITILTIMIVLVGAVFADPLAADDQAQIHVGAEVLLKTPVFSLQAASFGEYGAGDHAVINKTDVMEHGTVSAEDIQIGDDVLTANNATVNFVINQTALSRVKGTYTLTVTSGDLVITKITKADGTKVTTDLDTENNRFGFAGVTQISKGESGTAPANTTMENGTLGVLAITYNGKKVDAGTILGKFSLTWNKNPEAAAGDYEADVTLTITSIN